MITHPSIQQDVFPAKYGNPKQLHSGSQCVPKCNNKYSIGLVAILVAAARRLAAAAAADAKTTTFGSCEKPFFYCPSLLLLRDCVAC